MRRPRRTAIALAVTVAAVALGPTTAGAQGTRAEAQVRDIKPVQRTIQARWRSLDGAELVARTEERTTVTLAADVFFEFDSADLTAEARDRLREVARQISTFGARPIAVTGHTDDRGDDTYNRELSRRRAAAVQAVLDERLDPGFTFQVEGLGETKPVVPNTNEDGSDNPEGRAANRRVEISYANG